MQNKTEQAKLPAVVKTQRLLPQKGRSQITYYGGGSYYGASANREFRSWNPVLASADGDLLPDLNTLVARARDLGRNHGLVSGAAQTITDNVVGIGLRLSAEPAYKLLGKDKVWADEWSAGVEALWNDYAESTQIDAAEYLNFTGMTTQVFRSAWFNGEFLSMPVWRPGQKYSTCFQNIEPDRLSNPDNLMDSSKLRAGVEINSFGAAIAYYIRKAHPGDMLMGGGDYYQWVRVPRKMRHGRLRMLHGYDKERPGQTRGRPALSAVLPKFRMHDQYEKAELNAAVVNGMVAAFIETPLDGEAIAALFQNQQDYVEARSDYEIKMESGTAIPLFPGDKMSSFVPGRPNTAFVEFTDNIITGAAASLGLPRELMLKDFSKTNYSSARAALMEATRFFLGRRKWLATHWAKPVYMLWLEEQVNAGRIEAPDFYDNMEAYGRCSWIGPGRGWVDPLKEASAAQLRMESGLSTLQRECAEQGLDWREVLEQIATEQAVMERLGLTRGDVNKALMQTAANSPTDQQTTSQGN